MLVIMHSPRSRTNSNPVTLVATSFSGFRFNVDEIGHAVRTVLQICNLLCKQIVCIFFPVFRHIRIKSVHLIIVIHRAIFEPQLVKIAKNSPVGQRVTYIGGVVWIGYIPVERLGLPTLAS